MTAKKDDSLMTNKDSFIKHHHETAVAEAHVEEKAAELSEFDKEVKKLFELQAGRLIADIPMSDPYWDALNAHRSKDRGV